MRTNRVPLDAVSGLGIFDVMARALSLRPQMPDRLERFDAVARGRHVPRRSWMTRLDNWLWRREQRALEAYLAGSRDIHDLEARIRRFERGEIHPYY